MLETGQFVFGPPPIPPFYPVRLMEDKLGKGSILEIVRRAAGAHSRAPHAWKRTRRSPLQNSVASSVVMGEKGNESKSLEEGTGEASKARFLERMSNLELEELACRQELVEIQELLSLSHEDLSSHY